MGFQDKRDYEEGCGCVILFLIASIPYVVEPTIEFINESDSVDFAHLILFCLLIATAIIAYSKYDSYKTEKRRRSIAEKNFGDECIKTEEQSVLIDALQSKNKLLASQNTKLQEIVRTKTPFKDVAVLTRDCISAIFYKEEHYLRYKSRPAIKSAELVKELKGKYNQLCEAYMIMQYRYDLLMRMFPELVKYIEDDESAVDAIRANSIEEFQEEYDHSKDYLTNEEYRNLSVDERNQLALDRYKERRRRSSWIAGVEYEMYFSHILRKQGYKVVDFGIQRGLNDLGRDIIATKNGDTFIIQCKRWSASKEIHENVICQLFGTTLHYKIVDKEDNLFSDSSKIYPILVTTGILSDTAKEFANKLGVKVLNVQMGEYPMIKCNINNGCKIYHLPFDQQYWRTKIDKPGEFYATSVKEATQAGFRRAFKHIIN